VSISSKNDGGKQRDRTQIKRAAVLPAHPVRLDILTPHRTLPLHAAAAPSCQLLAQFFLPLPKSPRRRPLSPTSRVLPGFSGGGVLWCPASASPPHPVVRLLCDDELGASEALPLLVVPQRPPRSQPKPNSSPEKCEFEEGYTVSLGESETLRRASLQVSRAAKP